MQDLTRCLERKHFARLINYNNLSDTFCRKKIETTFIFNTSVFFIQSVENWIVLWSIYVLQVFSFAFIRLLKYFSTAWTLSSTIDNWSIWIHSKRKQKLAKYLKRKTLFAQRIKTDMHVTACTVDNKSKNDCLHRQWIW